MIRVGSMGGDCWVMNGAGVDRDASRDVDGVVNDGDCLLIRSTDASSVA